MLKNAGHEVLFLDGIAAELSESDFNDRLVSFRPELVVLETKTPVVKRHWAWMERFAQVEVEGRGGSGAQDSSWSVTM